MRWFSSSGDGFTLFVHSCSWPVRLAATKALAGWLMGQACSPREDWIHDLGLVSTAPWSAEWAGRRCISRLHPQSQAAFHIP